MHYRQLGRTGLYVSEIALGVGTFGRMPSDQATADALVRCAVDGGVNLFDTADVYENGLSERMLGQALQNLGVARTDVVIASKAYGAVGPGPNDRGASRGHIMDAVKASLKRLKTDYIDLYQIHSNDTITPIEETVRALQDLVAQGLVRYVGCSNWPAYRIMKALGIAEHHGWARLVTAQVHYSLPARDVEREITPCCIDEGLGLLIWSPLAGGALTARGKPIPPYLVINLDRISRCFDVMESVGEETAASFAQIAIAWTLSKPAVASLLVGACSVEELAHNLSTADVELSADQLARLNAVSELPPEYPGWVLAQNGPNRIPKPFSPTAKP